MRGTAVTTAAGSGPRPVGLGSTVGARAVTRTRWLARRGRRRRLSFPAAATVRVRRDPYRWTTACAPGRAGRVPKLLHPCCTSDIVQQCGLCQGRRSLSLRARPRLHLSHHLPCQCPQPSASSPLYFPVRPGPFHLRYCLGDKEESFRTPSCGRPAARAGRYLPVMAWPPSQPYSEAARPTVVYAAAGLAGNCL